MILDKQTIIDIVKIFHLILMLVVLIGPWFINNKYILISILLLYVILIVQWSLIGFCIITKIEDLLSNKELDFSRSSGFIGRYLNKKYGIDKEFLNDIGTLILLLNGLYIHYKLMKLI